MDGEKVEIEKAEGGLDAEQTRSGRHFVPAVDIYEGEESLVVLVEMPGVSREDVDVGLEKGVLSVFGRSKPRKLDEGYRSVSSEFEAGHYQRSFRLSEEIDSERIEAAMKSGVLRLVLPKSSRMRSQRIEVKGA